MSVCIVAGRWAALGHIRSSSTGSVCVCTCVGVSKCVALSLSLLVFINVCVPAHKSTSRSPLARSAEAHENASYNIQSC